MSLDDQRGWENAMVYKMTVKMFSCRSASYVKPGDKTLKLGYPCTVPSLDRRQRVSDTLQYHTIVLPSGIKWKCVLLSSGTPAWNTHTCDSEESMWYGKTFTQCTGTCNCRTSSCTVPYYNLWRVNHWIGAWESGSRASLVGNLSLTESLKPG